jgi:hypothetical protein
MRPTLPVILTVALALPGVGQASSMSYSYLEGGYGETEIDANGLDADGEGYRVTGSIAIGPAYHLIAEYSTADLELSNTNIDVNVDTISVGFGYNRPINPRADVIGRFLYIESDVDLDSPFFGAEADDSGIGFQMRLRGAVTPRVEVEGGIDYVDLGDDETSLVVEGRYLLTKALALGAGIEFGDDTTTYGVALRYSFGTRVSR